MENLNNSGQQPVDQNTGGPLEGMSPQFTNMPGNDVNEENAVYAELGLDGQPDVMNPGDEEASDTILYTDNAVATDMTDMVAETATDDTLPAEFYNDLDNVSEARMDAEMDQLGDDENTDSEADARNAEYGENFNGRA